MTARSWTCRKRFGGTPCLHVNKPRKRVCGLCGTPRPARRKPQHLAALEMPYEAYETLNGGEHCGICGAARKVDGKRLHRDHDHRTGVPRGLLCFRCNGALRTYMTVEWLRAATAYLERSPKEAA